MAVFGLPGGAEIWMFIIVIGSTGLVFVFPLWILCRRLGYPGALSLLYYVPFGLAVVLFVLAYGKWRAQPVDTDPVVS